MSEYTPTTEEVQKRYAEGEEHLHTYGPAPLRTEFNRWLAAHDAEVRAGEADAWDAGYEAGAEDQAEVEGHRYRPGAKDTWDFDHWTKNPHRDVESPDAVVAEEPEWEYGVWLKHATSPFTPPVMSVRNLEAAKHLAALNPLHAPTYFRRRKAGPWVPVKQEGEGDE